MSPGLDGGGAAGRFPGQEDRQNERMAQKPHKNLSRL